jgi:drug/metabolite transporter (DMT)-like permease
MWRIWAAALLWGLNWPAVKIMLSAIGPMTLRATGIACGAGLLLGYAKLSGCSLSVPRAQWRHIVVGGILNVAAFNIFAVFAQLTMPTSRAAILTFTMPLWAAVFGWFVLGEKIDARRAMALTLGAVGLGVLALPFVEVIQAGGVPFGLVYVLGAAIFWAGGTVYLKKYPIAAEPLAVASWQVVVAAVVCTLGMLVFERPRFDVSSPAVAAAFLYHIAFPQAAAYVLWFSLIRKVPTGTATLGTLLIPIFGVVGAILLLGDWPGPTDIVGLVLILSAVVIDQVKRPAIAPARN